MVYRPNDLGYPRIGFAVSARRISSAVARNRLRRLARESFRLNQPELPAVDLVIMAKPDASRAANADLFRSLAAHWARIRRQIEQPDG